MKGLTAKQREVLEFIKAYVKLHGFPPTQREISDNFRWSSTNAAGGVIKALIAKDYIERSNGSRTIRVLKG